MTQLADLPLWARLEIARQTLEPVQSDYRVVFEADIDAPASVLVPEPNWMACALHGGILPPVEVYHKLEVDDEGKVLNGELQHTTPPVGPMTEEEAIEYLIQKDVPAHVWKAEKGNSTKMVICRANQLPTTRQWRDAWKIDQVMEHNNLEEAA